MIRLTFACGHRFTLDDANATPICPACSERRVSRVSAPAPRFSGWCQGPNADSKPLEGLPIAIPKEVAHG